MPDAETKSPARGRWWLHLVLITTYPLGIGLLSLGATDETPPALASTPAGLIIASVVALALFGIVFGAAWLASRASAGDLLLHWRRGFWPIPWGLGYSIALRFGIGVVAFVLAAILIVTGVMTPEEMEAFAFDQSPDVEAIVDVDALRQDPRYFWLMVTFVSFVVAGFREELWRAAFLAGMRALWPRRFASRGAQIGAMALAAVVFGLGHTAQGPIAVVMTGVLGFGLGVIMVLHRSIWPAVLAHGFFNATSFALIPLVFEKMQELRQALPLLAQFPW